MFSTFFKNQFPYLLAKLPILRLEKLVEMASLHFGAVYYNFEAVASLHSRLTEGKLDLNTRIGKASPRMRASHYSVVVKRELSKKALFEDEARSADIEIKTYLKQRSPMYYF